MNNEQYLNSASVGWVAKPTATVQVLKIEMGGFSTGHYAGSCHKG